MSAQYPGNGPEWPTGTGWDPVAPPPGSQPGPGYGAPRGPYSPYQQLPSYPPYPSTGYGAQGYAANYKGSRLGLPQNGPGSLAGQWRRFAARLLDGLIVLPLVAIVFVPFVIHIVHVVQQYPSGTLPSSVTASLQREALAATAGVIALEFLWEAVAMLVWGRTPGKAILHIRPLQVDQGRVIPGRLPRGRCWGRAGAYFGIAAVGSLCGLISLLDDVWCLWDGERQCLHDKLASTIVVND
jgi:uncharacterized RDD family membrane protein YckC